MYLLSEPLAFNLWVGVAENENAVYATIKTTGEETSPSTAATAGKKIWFVVFGYDSKGLDWVCCIFLAVLFFSVNLWIM